MTEYITLALNEELLEMQEKSLRLLVTTVMGEMKVDMRPIKFELNDMKDVSRIYWKTWTVRKRCTPAH